MYFRDLHTNLKLACRPFRLCSNTAQPLGYFPWCLFRCSCSSTICSSNSAHIPPEARRRTQRTHDDDTDTWRLHHGHQHHDPVSFSIDLQVEGVSHSTPDPAPTGRVSRWRPSCVIYLTLSPFRLDYVPRCSHHAGNSPFPVHLLESSPAQTSHRRFWPSARRRVPTA